MKNIRLLPSHVRSASVIAIVAALGSASMAHAQDAATTTAAEEVDSTEIVVTGVRASLERSLEIKRQNTGIVDGISAEDIGKFPDTNIAESLQRVSGVSIDRVNGEGAKVTVRGFGPGFNVVTLNGRALPTASIASVGQDQNGDFVSGQDRSFSFNNIASEGVSRLEVYKTARASIPSGGIGAAINIVTRRPLDGDAGFSGSIGGKLVYDETDTYDFARVTPEFSGLINWTNEDETFGVGLFASYQKRNNSYSSLTVNDWNVFPFAELGSRGMLRADGETVINNAPSDSSTLVAIPNDTRYNYSELSRERINAQFTAQFAPTDRVKVTGDVTFYQNDASELRADQTNWFNRPFDEITFDDNDQVATAIFLDDQINGTKDGGFENQNRATREKMLSFGLNAAFEVTDNLTLTFDGHHSKAEALPNNSLGHSSTLVAIAHRGIVDQQLSIVDGFARQVIDFDDSIDGNDNGVLDLGDLGTQVARSATSRQEQVVDEVRFDGVWEMGNDNRVSFGAAYRETDMEQARTGTYRALGDWGVGQIGDVEEVAGNLVQPFCSVCNFNDYDSGITGNGQNAFRFDATDLWRAYQTDGRYGNLNSQDGNIRNQVGEKIYSVYGQVEVNSELLGRPVNVVAGVRFEKTESVSTSFIRIPEGITWTADNDFVQVLSSTELPVTDSNEYEHILPGLDFSIDLTDTLKGRISFGRTIARPSFGELFAAATPGNPNRPTALDGRPGGNAGNPQLIPLQSDNFDVSLEWYFNRSSYLSVGFFDKRVRNFVGTGQTTLNLFGLRDPTSGAPGSRSGAALEYLLDESLDQSDVNLFTLTALIDQFGQTQAESLFEDALDGGQNLPQSFIDAVLGGPFCLSEGGACADTNPNVAGIQPNPATLSDANGFDVVANSSDPLFNFQVSQPLNNREAHIYGVEIAGQYFLGDTGFGVSGGYTLVRGDIGYDITASPTADQFALLGLSDTWNASLIFEKFGISARATYNWRDSYLTNNSRGGSRNPVFVESYEQFDVNVSYDVTENISVSLEGINLTGSNIETYARTKNQPWAIFDQSPRYYLGARLRF